MENYQLKPMTDFVQEQSEIMYNSAKNKDGNTQGYVMKFISVVPNYANFLKQENAMWMFIPCDDNGTPLPKPEMKPERNSFDEEDIDFDAQELHDYIKAKERCLFIVEGNKYEIADDVVFINDEEFMISKETGKLFFRTKSYRTLEEIANDPDIRFWLSETAIKKIGI